MRQPQQVGLALGFVTRLKTGSDGAQTFTVDSAGAGLGCGGRGVTDGAATKLYTPHSSLTSPAFFIRKRALRASCFLVRWFLIALLF